MLDVSYLMSGNRLMCCGLLWHEPAVDFFTLIVGEGMCCCQFTISERSEIQSLKSDISLGVQLKICVEKGGFLALCTLHSALFVMWLSLSWS